MKRPTTGVELAFRSMQYVGVCCYQRVAERGANEVVSWRGSSAGLSVRGKFLGIAKKVYRELHNIIPTLNLSPTTDFCPSLPHSLL